MTIKIDQALASTVLNGLLGLDIVHENGLYSSWSGSAYSHIKAPYKPRPERAFLAISNFPAGKQPMTLADTDQIDGVFQVVVAYPVDDGTHEAKAMAEAVLDLFAIGARLTYSGQTVHINTTRRNGGLVEDGFYKIVCAVEWTAYTSR
jgi:hypothetical protein